MKQERIKQTISNYLSNQGYDVLDMFYKMPCDSCETIDSWDKFRLVPDLLIKSQKEISLVFVLIEDDSFEDVKEFIKENSDILPFKIYFVKANELYEIENLEEISSKKLLTNQLSIEEAKSVGSTRRTFKSQVGKWEENRQFGLRGEKKVNEILNSLGAKIIDLNFNAPCDSCSNIQNWKKYNKLPDGIAKLDGDVFFYDAKAKRGRVFRVNERDYIEYQTRSKFLPVKIYFVIFAYDKKTVKEIYVHTVNFNEHKKVKEWDGNYTVELSSELEQVG